MHRIAIAVATILSIFLTAPAWAQSEIIITQTKALAGGVTPGDTPGYPITLSQPGAYILGSNLSVTANQYGIFPTTANVDIDLNGFRINGGNVAYYALVANYGQSRIHGGVVSQFRGPGLLIRSDAWTIEDMKIVQNGAAGVDAQKALLIDIRNSLIAVNKGSGVISGDFGFFKGNKIVNNEFVGLACGISCHVEDNLISINKGSAITMFDGFVIGNTIARNSGFGLYNLGAGKDTGYTNNMFIENNPTGTLQVSSGVVVDPNYCAGKPCIVP